MVLKQFSSIYMLHTRFGGVWNCRVLKHRKIKEPLFCKEAKLHGAQALQPLKITNVQVWKKIKLQGSQTCYCAAKTKKLQGTQTFTGWSLRQQRVWQRIKLHGTQTRAATDPLVLEKKKLHGTQTRFFWCADEFPAWKGDCRILKQALCVAALALWLGGE